MALCWIGDKPLSDPLLMSKDGYKHLQSDPNEIVKITRFMAGKWLGLWPVWYIWLTMRQGIYTLPLYIHVVDMTIILFHFACCIYCEYQIHVYAQFGIFMFHRIACSTLFLATPKIDSLGPMGCHECWMHLQTTWRWMRMSMISFAPVGLNVLISSFNLHPKINHVKRCWGL